MERFHRSQGLTPSPLQRPGWTSSRGCSLASGPCPKTTWVRHQRRWSMELLSPSLGISSLHRPRLIQADTNGSYGTMSEIWPQYQQPSMASSFARLRSLPPLPRLRSSSCAEMGKRSPYRHHTPVPNGFSCEGSKPLPSTTAAEKRRDRLKPDHTDSEASVQVAQPPRHGRPLNRVHMHGNKSQKSCKLISRTILFKALCGPEV